MAEEVKPPVAIRITRPHASEDEFVEREFDTLTRTSVVLVGAQSRPQGVILRFEVVLTSGASVLRGEGRVVAFKPAAYGGEPGLTLRFTRLDSKSKALVDRAAALREARVRAGTPPAGRPGVAPSSGYAGQAGHAGDAPPASPSFLAPSALRSSDPPPAPVPVPVSVPVAGRAASSRPPPLPRTGSNRPRPTPPPLPPSAFVSSPFPDPPVDPFPPFPLEPSSVTDLDLESTQVEPHAMAAPAERQAPSRRSERPLPSRDSAEREADLELAALSAPMHAPARAAEYAGAAHAAVLADPDRVRESAPPSSRSARSPSFPPPARAYPLPAPSVPPPPLDAIVPDPFGPSARAPVETAAVSAEPLPPAPWGAAETLDFPLPEVATETGGTDGGKPARASGESETPPARPASKAPTPLRVRSEAPPPLEQELAEARPAAPAERPIPVLMDPGPSATRSADGAASLRARPGPSSGESASHRADGVGREASRAPVAAPAERDALLERLRGRARALPAGRVEAILTKPSA